MSVLLKMALVLILVPLISIHLEPTVGQEVQTYQPKINQDNQYFQIYHRHNQNLNPGKVLINLYIIKSMADDELNHSKYHDLIWFGVELLCHSNKTFQKLHFSIVL